MKEPYELKAANRIDGIIAILEETKGFASTSYGARNNLDEAIDCLDGLQNEVVSQLEKINQSLLQLKEAALKAIDEAYERGWSDCVSEPRPFKSARESMKARFLQNLDLPLQGG